jgi:hypothetical protein
MSSVAPNDSVSSSGKKKRPGKAQRAAAKNLPSAPSATTAASSLSGAARFSAGANSDPVPQPGRYPVVFPSGAGEATRDAFFAYDGSAIGDVLHELPERYEENARFTEFKSHAGMTSSDFETEMVRSALLGLAQQTVHAHVNMGLPQGDFSPVFSSDVTNFAAVRAIVSQFGEFSSDLLGSRFLLPGYAETVKGLVRAAAAAPDQRPRRLGKTLWLPTGPDDRNARFVVAHALAQYLEPLGATLDVERLAAHTLHSTFDVWDDIKSLLGDPPEEGEVDVRDRFDFLFSRHATESSFFTAFNDPGRLQVLESIGLHWPAPEIGDLQWSLNVKETFSQLSDLAARKRATYTKFFSCGSGLANRSSAVGSSLQASEVTSSSGVVVVKSLIAQAAPEYSLLACFPLSGRFAGVGHYRVVLTTSINVAQRATEFTQLDWL